jgi:hypothetical protein
VVVPPVTPGWLLLSPPEPPVPTVTVKVYVVHGATVKVWDRYAPPPPPAPPVPPRRAPPPPPAPHTCTVTEVTPDPVVKSPLKFPLNVAGNGVGVLGHGIDDAIAAVGKANVVTVIAPAALIANSSRRRVITL